MSTESSAPIPSRVDRATTSFVWLVWLGMLAAALYAVVKFASRIPYWDEWNGIVPVLTRQQPVTLAWLWSPHNEHRILLPRLVMLGLLRLSGDDFRIGAYLNVFLLAAIAAVGMRTAAALRGGRAAVADALFPLLLIHLRHFENIFWMFQCQVVLSVLLTFWVFCSAIRFGDRMPARRLLTCAVVCLLIPLCGAFDLLLALPLALWIGVVAWLRLRRISSLPDAAAEKSECAPLIATLGLTAAFLLLIAAYFIGLKQSSHVHPDGETAALFVVSLTRFGLGETLSQPVLVALSYTVPVLLPVALVLLALRGRQTMRANAGDSGRLAAFALYLLGAFLSLASIAYGRPEATMSATIYSRYALLTAQLVLGLYLAFLALAAAASGDAADAAAPSSVRQGRRWSDVGLLSALLSGVAAVLAIASLKWAWATADDFTDPRRSMDADMAQQVPLPRLMALYGRYTFPSREYAADHIVQLARDGLGAFRGYQPDYAFAIHPLSLGDPKIIGVSYVSNPPDLKFTLPPGAREFVQQPDRIILANPPGRQAGLLIHVPGGLQRVRGVRFHVAIDFPDGAPVTNHDVFLNLQWQHTPRTGQPSTAEESITDVWHPLDKPVTLYIDEPVDACLLLPYGRYRTLTITGIDLLLPVSAAAPGDRIETGDPDASPVPKAP